MTPQKIIFGILAAIIIIVITYIVLQLDSKTETPKKSTSQNLSIWVLGENIEKVQELATKFQEKYPDFSKNSITVESFDDALSYESSLAAGFLKGEGPDIFMLSSSNTTFLESYTKGIHTDYISPSDFRLKYFPIFGERLIYQDPTNPSYEYIKGVPFGFQTLGLYYNKKYFLKASELETWSDLAFEVKNIHEKYSNITPLALGNGSNVSRAVSILSAFFAANGQENFSELPDTTLQSVIELYQGFGDENGDNAYNSLSAPLSLDPELDFFTQGNVASMFGTLADLGKIDSKGYPKNFLFATHFPYENMEDKNTWIDFNYLVMSQNSAEQDMAQSFLSFLSSDEGQKTIHELFPYQLPAHAALTAEIMEKKIHPNYNVVYKNFFSPEMNMKTFTFENKAFFSQGIKPFLDSPAGTVTQMKKLSNWLMCASTKANTQMNLSSPCLSEK